RVVGRGGGTARRPFPTKPTSVGNALRGVPDRDPSMKHTIRLIAILLLGSALLVPGAGQGRQGKGKPVKPETEADYYNILTSSPPAGEGLEAGAIEVLPDGKVAVGTRRGEVWLIDNAYDADPKRAKFTRFAHGLHEVLGLAQKDGWLYVTQRPDVSRLKDTDG